MHLVKRIMGKVSESRWTRFLAGKGISKQRIDQKRREFTAKFGHDASFEDTAWALFNELLLDLMRKKVDLHELGTLYYQMALFVDEEGKNAYQMLANSAKMNLREYRKSSVKKVEIIASRNSCPNCQKQDGLVLTVSKALENMPIPRKDCTFPLNNDTFGFCRCCYGPIV